MMERAWRVANLLRFVPHARCQVVGVVGTAATNRRSPQAAYQSGRAHVRGPSALVHVEIVLDGPRGPGMVLGVDGAAEGGGAGRGRGGGGEEREVEGDAVAVVEVKDLRTEINKCNHTFNVAKTE